MPIEQSRGPTAGTTYKGFSGGAAPPPERRPASSRTARPPRRRRRLLFAAGLAVALAAGVAFGYVARLEFLNGPAGSQRQAGTPVVPAPASPPTPVTPPPALTIAQAPPPPTAPAAQVAGRLETLPPEMAAASQGPVRRRAESPDAAIPDDDAPAQSEAASTEPAQPPARAAPQTPAAPEAPPPAPAPQLHASFDCAAAQTEGEQLVCSDPMLAAADRQMSRAYRRALRAGVDPAGLSQEQQDWAAIREDAARHSRRAVAQVYDQRIRELNEMAAEAPGQPGDDQDNQDDGE
jgi:uncharacterized protein YecT (DUF1311 family)